ncbi:MAG TPA: TetR/AcrR family transcriptional regulator [Solirubrobacterales bacterium]|nr:TetR/AcrR family transcriptional regulator [Solirubrobacterales bacterium]
MTGTRTRLDPDVRREQILTAARAVFIADDYANASMEAVAERAGVTTGLVNHYFGTKRDLYLAVVEDLAAGLPEMVEVDSSGLPLEQLVDRNMDRFLDAFERNHEVLAVLLGDRGGLGRDPDVAAIMSRARDGIVLRMAVNHAGEEEPSPELLLALRVFQGAAEAAVTEWLRRGRASRAEIHELLKRTLIAMIGDLSSR